MTVKIQEMGYDAADARARVCQDIILKAIDSIFDEIVTFLVKMTTLKEVA